MADVYLATDQSLGRKVAIKILSDRYARDAGFVERFRREAAAAAALRHPNIVTVYDRGEAMGTSYIAMEYLDGPTLKEEITRRAPLPEPEAINYATQALAALDAAHRQGVVHRDIKPHNMVLTDEGRLKVTDFGIARAAQHPADDRGGLDRGHRPVPLARAGARARCRPAVRHLLDGRRALRDALRRPAVHRRLGRRHRHEAGVRRAPAAAHPKPAGVAGDGAGGDAGAGQGSGAAVRLGAADVRGARPCGPRPVGLERHPAGDACHRGGRRDPRDPAGRGRDERPSAATAARAAGAAPKRAPVAARAGAARPRGVGRIRRLQDAERQRPDRATEPRRPDLQAGPSDAQGGRAQGQVREGQVQRRPEGADHPHRPDARVVRLEGRHGEARSRAPARTRSRCPSCAG